MSKTFVIIDDDNDDIYFVREALTAIDPDFRITEYSDLDIAWDRLMDNKPDFILMDVNIPGTSAADSIKKFRTELAFDATDIIMYSSSMNDTLNDQLVKMGANFTFEKPYTMNQYVNILSSIISVKL